MNFYVEKQTKQQINLDNVYCLYKNIKTNETRNIIDGVMNITVKKTFLIEFEGVTKPIYWNFDDEKLRDQVYDDLIDFISMKEFVYPGNDIDWNNEGYVID